MDKKVNSIMRNNLEFFGEDAAKFWKLAVWDKLEYYTLFEEAPEEVEFLIVYEDHGDEFIFVQRTDGTQCKYGYFLNRKKTFIDRDELWERRPLDLNNPDDKSEVSNDLYRALHGDFSLYPWGGYKPYKLEKERAQIRFEQYCEEANKAAMSGVIYDHEKYRSDVEQFLRDNDIYTEENAETLKNLRLSSKDKNGCDGAVGKLKVSNINELYMDRVLYAWFDGKSVPVKDLVIIGEDEYDEWGYENQYIPFSQFSKKARTNIINELLENIREVKDIYSKVDIYKLSLQQLIELSNAWLYFGRAVEDAIYDFEDEEDEEDE